MRSAPAAVISFLNANNVGFRCDLYTLTLLSGTVYTFTSADYDVVYGGTTYVSGVVLSRTKFRQTSRLELDSIELALAGSSSLGGKTISLQVIAGLFDGARLQIDHLVGSDLPNAISNGAITKWWEGRVAAINPGPVLVVESELSALNLQLPRYLWQLQCGNVVYDPNCTLAKATYTLSGTASGSPTSKVVPTATAALTAKAAGYFNLGVLAFTSGANAGLRRAVSAWDGTNFTLSIPFPSAPAAGDAFTVYPGCDRSQGSGGCGKFANLTNFRGFAHIPTPEGGK